MMGIVKQVLLGLVFIAMAAMATFGVKLLAALAEYGAIGLINQKFVWVVGYGVIIAYHVIFFLNQRDPEDIREEESAKMTKLMNKHNVATAKCMYVNGVSLEAISNFTNFRLDELWDILEIPKVLNDPVIKHLDNGRIFYVNPDGECAFEATFPAGLPFNHGVARVMLDGGRQVSINKNGNIMSVDG